MDANFPHYSPGQDLACTVTGFEPGGYVVAVHGDNLQGFLPTEAEFSLGQNITAQFVCIVQGRILLTGRFPKGSAAAAPAEPIPPLPTGPQPKQSGNGDQAKNDPDLAFSIWAQHRPSPYKARRAIDVIPPAMAGSEVIRFNFHELPLDQFIQDLESNVKTGAVKAFCEKAESRSAILLYQGRVVAAVYGNPRSSELRPIEATLPFMLADWLYPDTEVMFYPLADGIVLSLSALFLGYPVARSGKHDTKSYTEYIVDWFREKKHTSCIVFWLPATKTNCLAFFYRGRFIGWFHAEDQRYSQEMNSLKELVASDSKAQVNGFILPSEMVSSAIRFGYTLSGVKPINPTSAW